MMTRMPSRPLALLVLAPVAGVALAACSSGGDLPVNTGAVQPSGSGTPAAVVLLRYDSVEPSRVTIHAGQTVEWRWQDPQFPSNVTFDSFASPTMDSGTWSYTFNVPGTYNYRDSLRAEATGVVVVEP